MVKGKLTEVIALAKMVNTRGNLRNYGMVMKIIDHFHGVEI